MPPLWLLVGSDILLLPRNHDRATLAKNAAADQQQKLAQNCGGRPWRARPLPASGSIWRMITSCITRRPLLAGARMASIAGGGQDLPTRGRCAALRRQGWARTPHTANARKLPRPVISLTTPSACNVRSNAVAVCGTIRSRAASAFGVSTGARPARPAHPATASGGRCRRAHPCPARRRFRAGPAHAIPGARFRRSGAGRRPARSPSRPSTGAKMFSATRVCVSIEDEAIIIAFRSHTLLPLDEASTRCRRRSPAAAILIA
jgi:hypothetical protein